ncbi:MAG TPA: efflux RND transporter periplasmic adaptor subunit [Polyangia bacterium]|nr:efflux RND transporter periplasmic adaptor subunit [Polyangia bacterium]
MNSSASRAVLLGLLVVAGGCSRSAPQAPSGAMAAEIKTIAVTVVEAKPIKVPRILTLSGTLAGTEEADVAAGAAGKVVATYVERGSVVHKGAVLARLDSRTVSAQAQEAGAQLESLKAQESQAQADCARNERLFEKGAIARADFDRAATQCKTSKWSVSAAEARKRLYGEALLDTEIRAPFSGMIVERAVSPGEYVRPDSKVVTLVDVDSLRVELTVPEADVTFIKQGMPVDFRTASDENKVHQGKIRYVGPSVRKQTRDAVVEAVVKNEGRALRPGMFVTAKVALGDQTLPAVPATAVKADGTLRHVFTVAGGRVEDRLVQVGEVHGDQIPIINGLKLGEKVVAPLTPDVRDGARVK